MQRRLDRLSSDASEAVRVAAVLPERFSAGLLAAMLERQPSSLMSALAEAVRAGLLTEDGEQHAVSARLDAGGRPAGLAAVVAPGNGAPVGLDHAEHGRGPH